MSDLLPARLTHLDFTTFNGFLLKFIQSQVPVCLPARQHLALRAHRAFAVRSLFVAAVCPRAALLIAP